MNEEEIIKKLTEEGYKDVTTVKLPPNQDLGIHTHNEATVHIILFGEITMVENGKTDVLKKGDRVEIPKGTTHSVKCGPSGCVMVMGVKL